MRITEKDFNKLPQMDRVEIVVDQIAIRNKIDNGFSYIISLIFMMSGMIMNAISLVSLALGAVHITKVILIAGSSLGFIGFLLMVYSAFESIREQRLVNRVVEDYFKIVPKRRKE